MSVDVDSRIDHFPGAGHCTGWRAMSALAAAFGDAVLTPTAVGKRFLF